MWITVHEAIFNLNHNVTSKVITNWICTTESENKSSILDYIVKNVDYKPNYYDKLVNVVECEYLSNNALLSLSEVK